MHTQRYAHDHNAKLIHDVALGFDDVDFLGRSWLSRMGSKAKTVAGYATGITPAKIILKGVGHVGGVVGRGTGHGVMSLTRGTGHVVGNVGRGVGGFVSSNVRTIAPVIGNIAEAYMNKGGAADAGPAQDVQTTEEKVAAHSSMLKNPYAIGGGVLLLAGVAFLATRKRK